MYAIFRTGGKEYKVSPGDVVRVEKLPAEPGTGVEFNHVFAVRKQQLTLGSPLVEGAKVTGTVLRNARAPKVRVFKFKASKQYRRTGGHRQDYSEVRITDIVSA
ncbi:MAG TPA: 50S ribosomal protein L21 [Terriglobia bacterium]|jgi:large subunit ribosomal protein L21|nr:50S ribosomal protein L21 [Terriglobia bacterium]